MKSKLIVFVLGASLLTGSTAVLADRGKGGGHDRPRAEQRYENRAQDRHWDGRRDHSYGKHYARGHRGRHWGHRHGRHWGHRGHYRPYAMHPAPRHGHFRHLPPPPRPHDSLSIILHGHF